MPRLPRPAPWLLLHNHQVPGRRAATRHAVARRPWGAWRGVHGHVACKSRRGLRHRRLGGAGALHAGMRGLAPPLGQAPIRRGLRAKAPRRCLSGGGVGSAALGARRPRRHRADRRRHREGGWVDTRKGSAVGGIGSYGLPAARGARGAHGPGKDRPPRGLRATPARESFCIEKCANRLRKNDLAWGRPRPWGRFGNSRK